MAQCPGMLVQLPPRCTQCVKQSTHAATVQNVDPTQACAVYKAKRLVYHDRLKSRSFPHSDHPQTSEISEVCVRRNSVPIQRTPFGLSLAPRVFTKCVEAAIA